MTWEWQYIKNKIINYCKDLPNNWGFWIAVGYYLVVLIAWRVISNR